MGLFGSPKTKITPSAFVTEQLDKLFSNELAEKEKENLTRLSEEYRILQNLSVDKYIEERQRVIYNLLQIAWDRNIPYAMFMESGNHMRDDPRSKSIDNQIYGCSLYRAQEAGMDTFGFIALLFVDQIISHDSKSSDSDYSRLCQTYKMEFTELYIFFEKLIKRHTFIK